MSNTPEKKGMGAIDFFCIGFGAIVGVGWAVSINGWMSSCGGPVPASLGYLMVLLIMVPFGLVYAELVPLLPVAGGGSAFAYAAFGEKISFLAKKAFAGVYDGETVDRWLKTFLRRFFVSQFKRSCAPDAPQAGPVSLSPRGGLRLPSGSDFPTWMGSFDR